jgi:hypothetical protein
MARGLRGPGGFARDARRDDFAVVDEHARVGVPGLIQPGEYRGVEAAAASALGPRQCRAPLTPNLAAWEIRQKRSGKGVISVKKRIVALAAALALAASGVASAAIDEGNGRGNPDTNASGKCPAGQNKDTSPGGLKKC